jgi:hypothetical protein
VLPAVAQGFTIIGPPLHYWYTFLSTVSITGLAGAQLALPARAAGSYHLCCMCMAVHPTVLRPQIG